MWLSLLEGKDMAKATKEQRRARKVKEREDSKQFVIVETEMRLAFDLCGSSMVRFCVLVAQYMGFAGSNKNNRKGFVETIAAEYGMDKAAVFRAERNGKASMALEEAGVANWPQLPANDGQLRPLAMLLSRGPEIIGKAWGDALESIKGTSRLLTAEIVRDAVEEYLPVMAITSPASSSTASSSPSNAEILGKAIQLLEAISTDLWRVDGCMEIVQDLDKIRGRLEAMNT